MKSDSCRIMRRKLVRHSTVNIVTGERSAETEEWVTEPCGVPLFGEREVLTGVCRSCANGWTHENNYPVEPICRNSLERQPHGTGVTPRSAGRPNH